MAGQKPLLSLTDKENKAAAAIKLRQLFSHENFTSD